MHLRHSDIRVRVFRFTMVAGVPNLFGNLYYLIPLILILVYILILYYLDIILYLKIFFIATYIAANDAFLSFAIFLKVFSKKAHQFWDTRY